MQTGYGLSTPSETGSEEAVGERRLSTGPRNRVLPDSARTSMVDVDDDGERSGWWAATSEDVFLGWVADRSASTDRHLVPVLSVGRTPDGRLAAAVLRPSGVPIGTALDRIGVPNVGVAVTLTMPLLDLAVAASGGAIVLGTASPEDVVVDDSGAVVLCDRPPASVAFGATVSSVALSATTRGTTPTPHGARALPSPRTPPGVDGLEAVLLAVRQVWERVDPRDPCRPAVDAAVRAARSGRPDDVTAARSTVRRAAAPRPVRWDPPRDLFDFVGVTKAERTTTEDGSLDAVLEHIRDLVEHGVPFRSRRVPLRQVVVAVVVAVGVAGAAVLGLSR
ncbi:hypothetical protein JOE58_000648 [Curtobacterium luteum]|uniref:Uncharacterized protein n=1 Tax=Curtobacterium luteum TaxID=33881 RepID=A0A8H9G8V8_9MICO|nr:hypothetical protein [Curtobacterium luteum]MBM7801397.1 hypothetical protein [Curtobacterium luteum]NUU49891.1 hypothetical protein [Curtobacterium luteum]GGK90747.1 hypothetical protein GCM10009769_06100 [Curtobacterium luteum]